MDKHRLAIIGGGIGGLSAAWFAREKFRDRLEIHLFEKQNRLGGTIGTTRKDGFLIDWGPNGFLDKEPLTLEFIEKIGLSDKLLPSDKKSAKRFIFRNNRLWEINPNPAKFLHSGLLSLPGRLRIVMELLVRGKIDNLDESIYDFAARRIGREAAETLIDPMVSGIYGGDARKLSLGACFPVMERMERQYGGLIKAMIKRKKAARRAEAKSGGPAGPSGHLTSFSGGLYTLVEHLEKILKNNLEYPVEIEGIARAEDGKYILNSANGKEQYDAVILAVPSYVSANLLEGLDREAAILLGKIRYSNLAVVCQGYKLEKVGHPLDGFGFLIPHSQNMNILGSIWTSVIFPEQAPPGYALFRTMLGGDLNNEIIHKSHEELSSIAQTELGGIMRLDGKPDFEEIFLWDQAIPQYTLGHRDRLAFITRRLEALGNIYLAGNAFTGIGLNDTIKRSYQIVEALTFQ